ncbi:hypothetical protein E4O05_01430 [Treponema sp. OMZ 787]|uniref:hypothetical protein n=1 Tax=Treponema sp. OMZ 787 TaxID=2563669 RepID=UPI0020A48D2C|nr:hypothetical protein [Treponema sp. OMZ 787]UTC62604.1 hypothetical protein E4O05_01430 [Treponema sp. OMZ 787]
MAYTNEALGKALEDLTRAYDNFIKNAKDAAMEAMGDTVIDQIKQDAKDHISAELAAQKAALEQAIENAKAAINNSSSQAHTALQQAAATASGELTSSAEAKKLELTALIQSAEQALQGKVNEAKTYIDGQLSAASQGLQEDINTKVSAAVATAEATLLAKINTKFIEYYKNGYIQMPGMPSPLEDASLHFEGYSWHEVNYDGNFFRAKGRNAKVFSSKKLTIEQIKNGDYIFQDDEQGDAIRNIYGSVIPNASLSYIESSGVFTVKPLEKTTHAKWGWDGGQIPLDYLGFDLNGVVPTAEENRSRNLTFTIWALVKDK